MTVIVIVSQVSLDNMHIIQARERQNKNFNFTSFFFLRVLSQPVSAINYTQKVKKCYKWTLKLQKSFNTFSIKYRAQGIFYRAPKGTGFLKK